MNPIQKVHQFYRSRSPLQVAALTPFFILLTCLGTVCILSYEQKRQLKISGIPLACTLTWWALAATVFLLVLTKSRLARCLGTTAFCQSDAFKAYVVAFQIGLVLLLIPVHWAYQCTYYHRLTWTVFEYQDKRWLFALYWIAVFTFLIGPAFCYRLLCSARCSTTAADVSGVSTSPSEEEVNPLRWYQRPLFARTGVICVSLAISLFYAGPPWNVDVCHRAIDPHEQVHLGPLQALHRGSLPYIGPASIQYGPGAQCFAYLYMKLTNQFSIVGYRESQALCHFVTLFILCITVFLTIDICLGLIIIPMTMAFSPLCLFNFHAGVLDGYYGWGNGLRYSGILILAVSIPSLVRRVSTGNSGFSVLAVCSGFTWGLFCWFAQENLSGGLAAGTLLLVLLWSTQTVALRGVLFILLNLSLGFLLFWLPLIGFYACHGCCHEFLSNYFLGPRMVMQGWCNRPWWESGHKMRPTFMLAWVFFLEVGILTLWDLRRFTFRSSLGRVQVTLLSFLCVSLACYATSLFRSDSTHLKITMLATPAVVVLAIAYLPSFQTGSWLACWLLRGLILAAAVYVFPDMFGWKGFDWPKSLLVMESIVLVLALVMLPAIAAQKWPVRWSLRGLLCTMAMALAALFGWVDKSHLFDSFVSPYWARYHHPDEERVQDGEEATVAFRRAGSHLTREPLMCAYSVPMLDGLRFMNEIHDLVRSRKTYVSFWYGLAHPGLFYFMADLHPAPVYLDIATMVVNSDLRDQFLKHFNSHISDIECVISITPDAPEMVLFRGGHPDAVFLERIVHRKKFYIAMTPDG